MKTSYDPVSFPTPFHSRYLGTLGMPAVPANAVVPVLTEKVVASLKPYAQKIGERLAAGEELAAIATDIAPRARVTPGQVVKYVVALSRQNRPQPHTGGFPVLPPKPMAVIPLEPGEHEMLGGEMAEKSVD
jgi:hypothetical protein